MLRNSPDPADSVDGEDSILAFCAAGWSWQLSFLNTRHIQPICRHPKVPLAGKSFVKTPLGVDGTVGEEGTYGREVGGKAPPQRSCVDSARALAPRSRSLRLNKACIGSPHARCFSAHDSFKE